MNSRVFDVIKNRSSIRHYIDKPVEQEKLDMILESARLAPSATNAQPWHFYVVRDRKKIDILGKMPLGSQAMINPFVSKAPLVIVATAGPIDIFHKVMSYIVNKKWYYLDVAIAVEHMVLTAEDLGLGSCWIGWFNEKMIKKVVGVPANEEVIAMITLGYPMEGQAQRPKDRKDISEIVKYI